MNGLILLITDNSEYDSSKEKGVFLSFNMSRPALGSTQSHIHWYQRFLPGGKEQLEHDVDHFSSSNAKIKNEWS
jgi:hypothetical protein